MRVAPIVRAALEWTEVVARRREQATTTLDFSRKSDGAVVAEITKEYGSDLCGLSVARGYLTQFLKDHGFQPVRERWLKEVRKYET